MFAGVTLTCTDEELRPTADGGLACPITSGDAVINSLGLNADWYWLDQLIVLLYTLGFAVTTVVAQACLSFGTH